jgi:cyanophycin synthetase
LCLFSRDFDHPQLVLHRASGGCSVSFVGERTSARIVLTEGATEIGDLDICDIPATLGGVAMGKATNAAFAIAVAHGLDIPFAAAAAALRGFSSTPETNPGRLNLLRNLPFSALIDWTDGPVASAELASVARSLEVKGKRVLVLTAVGNRPDAFISASAESVAGHFDSYVCSNYTDLRGRSAATVPGLLRAGLLQSGVAEDRIVCIADFETALEHAIQNFAKDDLLVVASYAPDIALRRILASP